MDYTITLAMDRDGSEENVVDSFVAWFDAENDTVSRVSNDTWFIAAGVGFRRDIDDEGQVFLTTLGLDSKGLHQILSAFFHFSGKELGYAAVVPTDPDAPAIVSLISNDPAVEHDPVGKNSSGVMRSYQAAAVLGSAVLFERLSGQMFGHGRAKSADVEGEEEGEIVTTGMGPWLFAIATGAIDDAEETIILIGGDDISVEKVLQEVLRLPEYKIFAGDYYTFEDESNGAIVVAQPFPTHVGEFVELRLTLPPGMTESSVLDRVSQSAWQAGLNDVLHVIDYDDIEGTAQTTPLLTDGTMGPMRILKLEF